MKEMGSRQERMGRDCGGRKERALKERKRAGE